MARKPRIEIPGYYHVVNRGVEQRKIFLDPEDYDFFEELMCKRAQEFSVIIHNFCLMSNHYHILLEISSATLSKYMRDLNMKYAIYFNKKYKRSGHLWQGRFQSWYVSDEAYLFALMRYIEQNPLKAEIVDDLAEYPYSSYSYFVQGSIPKCLENSWLAQNFKNDTEAIKGFLLDPVDSDELKLLKKVASLAVAPNSIKKPNMDDLKKRFEGVNDTKERNKIVVQAYKEGFSQHMIAKVLGLNQATVNRIIKRTK